MNIRIKESKLALILVASLVPSLHLHAQTFALPFTLTQSSPALTFSIDTNGTLLETAPFNSSLSLTLTSGGSQMLWLPAYAAFRAGNFSGPSWTLADIGQYSAAFGFNTIASGEYSVAFGSRTTASGGLSTAFGLATTASNSNSFAVGAFVLASGQDGMALGDSTIASGTDSMAVNTGSVASGRSSFAAGAFTSANSYESFVLGQNNVGLSETGTTPNPTVWVSTDPLFEVGNGTGSGPTPLTDALVVYKNGSMTVQGPITAQSGVVTTAASVANTDIPMYSGN